MVDEGKGWLNPSRDTNEGKHRKRKVEISCVAFLLCDPSWYVHKSDDVQNKWDDNTQQTLRDLIPGVLLNSMSNYMQQLRLNNMVS